MTKRFATMFFIMIGVVVFLISAYLMVLFLAPGLSIFGLRYITINARSVDIEKTKIKDALYQRYGSSAFSGNIIVNSDNIPVIINFSETGYDCSYQYFDNFSGITKSQFEKPSLTVSKNENGDAILDVQSFQKFILQNANTERYIQINIPLADISVSDYSNKTQFTYDDGAGVANAYKKNLTINSGSGSISFFKNDVTRAPTFNEITIRTTDSVYNGNVHLKALTFNFETNKTVRINKTLNNLVDAKNYNINTTGGNILIERQLEGDLIAKTTTGDVKFISCNNLNAKTDLGNIKSVLNDKDAEVFGIANIETNAGEIKLGKVNGVGNNKITSGSGEVVIEKILNGEITTHRGGVNIKSVNDVSISSNMGNIYIEECLTSVSVTTKRGKIVLGAEGMIMHSPSATSNLGNISIVDASGDVNIESLSGNINFVNKSSTNIKIYAGNELIAKKLQGLVDLTINDSANISFDKINGTTKIKATTDCKFIHVEALSVVKTNLDYNFSGNPVSIYESNNTGYNTFSLIDSKNNLYNSNMGATKFQIIGSQSDGSNQAKVDVYFDKSAY